jgi:amidase
MGMTSGNLPAGLEILGRPFAETELFRLTYAYEQATHYRQSSPLFPALAE